MADLNGYFSQQTLQSPSVNVNHVLLVYKAIVYKVGERRLVNQKGGQKFRNIFSRGGGGGGGGRPLFFSILFGRGDFFLRIIFAN